MDPCSICGSEERLPYAGRPVARCPECGALERQRVLARDFADELRIRRSGRCLEAGPLNPIVYGDYLRQRDWHYEAVDKAELREPYDHDAFTTFIDHDRDLTDLHGIATASYELVLGQHFLEEIPDFRAALAELRRVLEPGGRAILEIPWDARLERHRPQEPDHYFNCWTFGQELLDDLRAVFDDVELRERGEPGYLGRFFVCGVR